MEIIRRGEITFLPRRDLQAFLQSPAGLWLRRRLSPRGPYGLNLTVGLVLIGLFSWALGGIVQDVLARDPLVRMDVSVLRFVHANPEPYLTPVVEVLEALLSPEVLLSAGVLTGSMLVVLALKRRNFRPGFYGGLLLVSVFGAGALAELSKALFRRDRPPAFLQLVPEAGHGFPSSHAVAVVVVGAVVWYLFALRPRESWGGSWRAKILLGLILVLAALLVGVGRVYTGAHYPSDVLAGWTLGGVWASVCLTAAEVFRRLREDGSEGSGGATRSASRTEQPNQPRGELGSSRPWWRRTFECGAATLSASLSLISYRSEGKIEAGAKLVGFTDRTDSSCCNTSYCMDQL
jgi:undecaprenyl-diphosphatase